MTHKIHQTTLCLALGVGLCAPVFADNHDPYEPYNRFMYKINDGIDRTVLVPVARGYQKITPKPVQSGVTNFFDNLRDVVSFGSNVLRLDVEKAGTDLVRVGLNTTFGLGGLINIADAAQIPNNKSSLGDTFATWGWKNSNYFVYPLTGPSTVRDAVGDTVTRVYSVEGALIDSDGWNYALTALKGIDKRAQLLVYTDGLDMAAVDRYSYTRDVFMDMRARQVGGTPPSSNLEDINIDDLVPASEADEQNTPALNDSSDLDNANGLDDLSTLNQETSPIATNHIEHAAAEFAQIQDAETESTDVLALTDRTQTIDDLALLH